MFKMLRLTSLFILFCVILFNKSILKTHALRVFQVGGEETILAFESEDIQIQCKSDIPMSYCGFVHPNGKRFSIVGNAVNDGNCALKIKVTLLDSGEWKCHVGLKGYRLETIKTIQVRIVDQFAAIQPNITTKLNKPVTITCVTTKGYVPIGYCRFEPPIGESFSIDSSINSTNAILDKYYFPPNNSLDRGDCAVTINHVKYEDAGVWTCGAGFEDGNEHIDYLRIDVEGLYNISTASATGLTFGGVLVIVIVVALLYTAWNKRSVLVRRLRRAEEIESHELSQIERPVTPQQERKVPVVVVESPSEPEESCSSPVSTTKIK